MRPLQERSHRTERWSAATLTLLLMKLGDSVHLKTLREYNILLYPCHLIYLPPANEVYVFAPVS